MNKYFKKWNLRMKVKLAQAMPRESGGHFMLYGVHARVMMRRWDRLVLIGFRSRGLPSMRVKKRVR